MMRPKRLLVILLILCSGASQVDAAEPIVSRILPRGGQRGTEIDLILRGQRLADSEELLFDRPGIDVLTFEAVNENQINAKIHIAENAMLGPYAIYVRTRTGISKLKLFSVGALAETREQEPNNLLAQANEVTFNTTVNGVAENEDLDIFAFVATKGQRISVEVEGIRLGDSLFDSYVAILDQNGFELATCDDLALLRQDAAVTIIAPQDGTYYATVRDASYAGNGNCMYRLHIGDFPRPTAIFPPGGQPGETIEFQLLGAESAPDPGTTSALSMTLTLPEKVSRGSVPGGWQRPGVMGVQVQDQHGISPSPNFLRVSAVPNTSEVEPNQLHDQATPFSPPAALNGILANDGDQDCFVFAAKKNERYFLAVFARQLRSRIDAVLHVNLKGGRQIVANDDTSGPDPLIDFTAPEDGEYVITIHDHLRKGAPDAVYRIEVWPAADVRSIIASLPRNFEYVAVPRGTRMASIVTAQRINFGGDLKIDLSNLPSGVTTQIREMHRSVGRMPIVLEAAPDTPLGAVLTGINLSHVDPNMNITGSLHQDIELVRGRNNVPYMSHSVDRVPVVVVEESPFTIEVTEPQAPLVRSGSMQLMVRATRADGFKAPIRLRVPWVPPGVGASQSIVIQPNQTEVQIPFNANSNAGLNAWPIVITAEANSGRGIVRTSSQLFTLNVQQPFISLAAQPTTVEQGDSTELFATLTRGREFEGNVTLRLGGLPNKVTAQPIEVPVDQKDFKFSIQTDAASPAGRHKNIFCIATVIVNGEPVVHRLPAAEVRIDKPLPKVAKVEDQPKPPPPAAAKSAPPPKRLTRLEKLRQEYEARRKQEKQTAEAEHGGAVETNSGGSEDCP